MAKKKRRRAFPTASESEIVRSKDAKKNTLPTRVNPSSKRGASNTHLPGGLFAFFRDFGVRETIESVIVAVVLALMFRAYEAEAFIIPTGSMAPTLQGQHTDFDCEKCGANYRAGASKESSSTATPDLIRANYCPMCQYRTKLNRTKNPNHNSNEGDRILVNKFIYDFQPPQRWDVIVFKNPNNGKQNYIKRLVGLPNEQLVIENGDIFSLTETKPGTWTKQIVRKPPKKMATMLQLVDDTNHVAKQLEEVNWPHRWQQWKDPTGPGAWSSQYSQSKLSYTVKGDASEKWLRYRHLIPHYSDWETIEDGYLPERMDAKVNGPGLKGKLISDYYCYNDRAYTSEENEAGGKLHFPGLHWVGDLGFQADVQIQSASGSLILDVVEAGAHFRCSIDVATGKAVLSCSDATVQFKSSESEQAVANPSAQTRIRGAGTYKIKYANCDDRIFLWVNNDSIEFDAAEFVRTSSLLPQYSDADHGDAEPLGIASKNVDLKIDRLRVFRDVYYTSGENIYNESGLTISTIEKVHNKPSVWTTASGTRLFGARKGINKPMFILENDQFLPMGDNSPQSLDGRVWKPGPNYVHRDMMIGRALFIYWPHSLNSPKYFPNFKRMGFIR